MKRIAIAAVGLLRFCLLMVCVPAETGPPQVRRRREPTALENSWSPDPASRALAVEGPAPVVTITAADITNSGFATMADVMASLTQNLGALDNNQNTDGFSPGAQAVDLRGLGPNHTLVLVNGRRIADYPQS